MDDLYNQTNGGTDAPSNGTMEFDKYFIFYLRKDNFVRFIYGQPNNNIIQNASLPIFYVEGASSECIEMLDDLMNRSLSDIEES
jgi:hypothetical protein